MTADYAHAVARDSRLTLSLLLAALAQLHQAAEALGIQVDDLDIEACGPEAAARWKTRATQTLRALVNEESDATYQHPQVHQVHRTLTGRDHPLAPGRARCGSGKAGGGGEGAECRYRRHRTGHGLGANDHENHSALHAFSKESQANAACEAMDKWRSEKPVSAIEDAMAATDGGVWAGEGEMTALFFGHTSGDLPVAGCSMKGGLE